MHWLRRSKEQFVSERSYEKCPINKKNFSILKSTETNGDGVLTHSLRAGVVDALAIAPPHHLSLMNLGFHALAGPQMFGGSDRCLESQLRIDF